MDRLHLWVDPIARSGPAAMAVDEWLLDVLDDTPLLRVYRWSGAWGTIGYFGSLAEARHSLPGLEWVRRWTGGGIVDHRNDWTYTLALPRNHPVALWKGALSYAWLHRALSRVLAAEGVSSELSPGHPSAATSLCFENPVEHDLVLHGGMKLAGAGQRRCREGFLHQGSVAAACDASRSAERAEMLAAELAHEWHPRDLSPPHDRIAGLVSSRYGNPLWNERR